ncbi:MAG: hypothetical protein JSS07_07440 [Proteobacteria bacterium]|nr:hypothetical protein [Pseudomonadota bacterium]
MKDHQYFDKYNLQLLQTTLYSNDSYGHSTLFKKTMKIASTDEICAKKFIKTPYPYQYPAKNFHGHRDP